MIRQHAPRLEDIEGGETFTLEEAIKVEESRGIPVHFL